MAVTLKKKSFSAFTWQPKNKIPTNFYLNSSKNMSFPNYTKKMNRKTFWHTFKEFSIFVPYFVTAITTFTFWNWWLFQSTRLYSINQSKWFLWILNICRTTQNPCIIVKLQRNKFFACVLCCNAVNFGNVMSITIYKKVKFFIWLSTKND